MKFPPAPGTIMYSKKHGYFQWKRMNGTWRWYPIPAPSKADHD
jgi:hypothetical protein